MASQIIIIECPTCESKLTLDICINLDWKIIEVLFGKSIHASNIEEATDYDIDNKELSQRSGESGVL